MSNLKEHFKKELEILRSTVKGEDDKLVIEDFIPHIESIIDTFSEQGHSGGSAPWYVNTLTNTIKNTLMFKPLSPITGRDDEWIEHDYDSNNIHYQNNRCSAVFKDSKEGKPHYIDAIVWQGEEDWDTFTGSVYLDDSCTELISSSQNIKLPFTPKTFYIDVIRKEVTEEESKKEGLRFIEAGYVKNNPDGTISKVFYISILKDPKQLEEVFEHYERSK